MGKPKYDPPTASFPFSISRRLNIMSVPRAYIVETEEGLPAYTPRGIRVSAIRAHASDRIYDAAWPPLRRLLAIKKMYKMKFTPERLEGLDRTIQAANSTLYAKLTNAVIDLKKLDGKDFKKKKAWSESEWKKHMDYIGQIAGPKKCFQPPVIDRGPNKPLDLLLPRLEVIAMRPEFKVYKRLSKEQWYRNPEKVEPGALKYVISERIKKLAVARAIPTSD